MQILGWTIIRAKNLARIHERNKELDKEVTRLKAHECFPEVEHVHVFLPVGSDLV